MYIWNITQLCHSHDQFTIQVRYFVFLCTEIKTYFESEKARVARLVSDDISLCQTEHIHGVEFSGHGCGGKNGGNLITYHSNGFYILFITNNNLNLIKNIPCILYIFNPGRLLSNKSHILIVPSSLQVTKRSSDTYKNK